LEKREIGRLQSAEPSDQMANSAQSFKAPQCKKRPQGMGAAAQRMGCSEFSPPPHERPLKTIPNALFCASLAKPGATNSTNFARLWRLSDRNFTQPFRE